MNAAPLDREADYKAWIDAVFAHVREQLSGEPNQSGNGRQYGTGVFGYGMDYGDGGQLGNVIFQVRRTDDLLKRTLSRVGPFEWYTIAPYVAAEELLRAFESLAEYG